MKLLKLILNNKNPQLLKKLILSLSVTMAATQSAYAASVFCSGIGHLNTIKVQLINDHLSAYRDTPIGKSKVLAVVKNEGDTNLELFNGLMENKSARNPAIHYQYHLTSAYGDTLVVDAFISHMLKLRDCEKTRAGCQTVQLFKSAIILNGEKTAANCSWIL